MLKQRARILVVEDDPGAMSVIVVALAGHYDLVTASNGADGLQRAVDDVGLDLIVTDVMMPEMTGFDMVRHLRADPLMASVPVIFLSAQQDEQSFQAAHRLRACNFLSKPCTAEQLLAAVERGLAINRSAVRRVDGAETVDTESDDDRDVG